MEEETLSRDSATDSTVRLHVFPEHRVQSRELPEWMQQSRKTVAPVRFGARPEDARGSQPEPRVAQGANARVDPLAAARTALDEARAAVKADQEALEATRAELENERTALAEAAVEISAAHASALEANTDQLAEIALAVIRTIITDAFSEAPERASALAHAALKPDSEAALRVGAALHIALLESGEASNAVLDASLAPYGCIAESASRRVIAGLEDRLDEVLRALKEAT
ncbi:MAG: flagellar biosynthesis/type III secretory pathway protein FliH [Polyangiales bacterium]|jgi:flagellar biosynthesis/type III secretory pathway protein FliH